MSPQLALAHAAESLVGTPFRLHGRDPRHGLDCLGLVGAALAAIGRPVTLPLSYRLKQRDIRPFLNAADDAELIAVSGPAEPGDIVLARPGPAQHHLLIATTEGWFVHAHAELGRVVLTPPPLPWPAVRQWRAGLSLAEAQRRRDVGRAEGSP